MLEVLGVLVDENTFRAFNCETGIDPQHLRGCGSRLLKLSRLGIGARQRDMSPLRNGLARYLFAAPMHRVPIALQHVIGETHCTKRRGRRKRIEADDCLQHLDRSCRFAHTHQGLGVSKVDEIWIEREGSLEFEDGGIVLALEKQDKAKLSASFGKGPPSSLVQLCTPVLMTVLVSHDPERTDDSLAKGHGRPLAVVHAVPEFTWGMSVSNASSSVVAWRPKRVTTTRGFDMTLRTMSFIFGAFLLAVGILGGSFEVKEVKVSNVTTSVRIFAGLAGLVFIGLGFWQPSFLATSDPARSGGPTATMSEREHDKDRYGGDYSFFDVSTDHIEDCEGACKADTKCVAWTYVRPGYVKPHAWCALKSVIPAISDNPCCVSGTKIH